MARQKQADAGTVAVRVLQDCAYGLCGAYADIPAAEVKSAKADGLIDDHPDAVAFALALAAKD